MARKFVSLLIASLFIAGVAYCATPTTGMQYDDISDFSKGQESHVNPYDTPPNAAVTFQNLRTNSTFGGMAKRSPLNEYLSYSSSPINGLFRYYQNNGNAYNMVATSTLMMSDTGGSSPSAFTIKDGLTTNARWSFLTYNNIAYAGDGVDPDIKWDGVSKVTANTAGSRSANELCAEMGAPFATLATGTGLTASSWYIYEMGMYDGTNYYYSSARSNAILTGTTADQIILSNIPLGENTITTRYLYRCNAQNSMANAYAATSFYLIGTLPNNTAQTFTDTSADSNGATPTWATVSGGTNIAPPSTSIFEAAQSRIWLSGYTSSPSNLYFSDTAHPEFFLASNYLAIRPDDGDSITFVKNNLGALTIGKTNTIQKGFVSGAPYNANGTFNWFITDPYSYIGCPAPFSVASTPQGIIYLARNGLYIFDGNKSQILSDPVSDVINDISPATIALTNGYFFQNEYRLAYTSLTSGGTSNNRILLYDSIRQSFVVDLENINCFAAQNSGLDFGVLYAGSALSDGYVLSENLSISNLIVQYKTDLDLGTFQSTNDTYNTLNNSNPVLQLGWTGTNANYLATLDSYPMFTITSASVYQGAVYTNSGESFTVLNPTGTVTKLQTYATGTSASSGTLTLSSGTGPTTLAFSSVASVTTNASIATVMPNATNLQPALLGTWVSPVYQVNATILSELYWNETLTAYGTVQFQIRTGSTAIACQSAAWSSPLTNPSGSSLVNISAGNYIQVQITLITTNNTYTPQVFTTNGFLFSIAYTKTGAPYETQILSVYQTGWKDFSKGNRVQIDRIKVFYTGSSSTSYPLTFNYINDEGDINYSFTIDLSITGPEATQQYTNSGVFKVFTFIPPVNQESNPTPIGQYFTYTITDNGTMPWQIERIETEFTVVPNY